jgi:hypothetical protein
VKIHTGIKIKNISGKEFLVDFDKMTLWNISEHEEIALRYSIGIGWQFSDCAGNRVEWITASATLQQEIESAHEFWKGSYDSIDLIMKKMGYEI